MENEKRYRALYEYVSEIEEKECCPWYVLGAWFNTAPLGSIDMETPSGALVTDDMDEIDELLEKDGLTLDFTDDGLPLMKKKEWEIRFH